MITNILKQYPWPRNQTIVRTTVLYIEYNSIEYIIVLVIVVVVDIVSEQMAFPLSEGFIKNKNKNEIIKQHQVASLLSSSLIQYHQRFSCRLGVDCWRLDGPCNYSDPMKPTLFPNPQYVQQTTVNSIVNYWVWVRENRQFNARTGSLEILRATLVFFYFTTV